jgi:hypothetical protein
MKHVARSDRVYKEKYVYIRESPTLIVHTSAFGVL